MQLNGFFLKFLASQVINVERLSSLSEHLLFEFFALVAAGLSFSLGSGAATEVHRHRREGVLLRFFFLLSSAFLEFFLLLLSFLEICMLWEFITVGKIRTASHL